MDNFVTFSAPKAIASSADGQKLVVASNDGVITSTDAGLHWALTPAPARQWVAVASSADGNTLIVAPSLNYGFGSIYTSTNSGLNWVPADAPVADWISVTCSADGNRLFAAMKNGGIYASQSVRPPVLNINRSGTELAVSWTIPSMNFVLQQNSDLTMTNWDDVTTSRNMNYGNLRYEVTVPTPTGSVFYRLISR